MGFNLDSKAGQFGMIVAGVLAGQGLYEGAGWVFKKIGGFFSKDKKDKPVHVTVNASVVDP